MEYSKASEQPQSSARPVCQSHAMTRTGREPATIRIAAYWSLPSYAHILVPVVEASSREEFLQSTSADRFCHRDPSRDYLGIPCLPV